MTRRLKAAERASPRPPAMGPSEAGIEPAMMAWPVEKSEGTTEPVSTRATSSEGAPLPEPSATNPSPLPEPSATNPSPLPEPAATPSSGRISSVEPVTIAPASGAALFFEAALLSRLESRLASMCRPSARLPQTEMPMTASAQVGTAGATRTAVETGPDSMPETEPLCSTGLRSPEVKNSSSDSSQPKSCSARLPAMMPPCFRSQPTWNGAVRPHCDRRGKFSANNSQRRFTPIGQWSESTGGSHER